MEKIYLGEGLQGKALGRMGPEFIRSRKYGPMAFTAESPPSQDQKSSRSDMKKYCVSCNLLRHLKFKWDSCLDLGEASNAIPNVHLESALLEEGVASLSRTLPAVFSQRGAHRARKIHFSTVQLWPEDHEREQAQQVEGGGFDSLMSFGFEDRNGDGDDSDNLALVATTGANVGLYNELDLMADATDEKEWNPATSASGRMAGKKVESAKRETPKNKAAESKKGMLEAIEASMIDEAETNEERGDIPSPVRIVSDYSIHSDSDANAEVDDVPASSDCTGITDTEENTTKLEGLSADEVEERLIAAGILHRDGEVFDVDELGGGGVYNEVDIPDGFEACQILVDSLGFDETEINYLRDKYAPLRGEPWYRRETTPGSKVGKKVLDIYFLKETLPELLSLLLGDEEDGGVGLSTEQVRGMLLRTPALAGVEPFDAGEVVSYMRGELGLDEKGQLAAALAGCPPMLMYNAQNNLHKKVRYYRDALSWSTEDIRSLMAEYPNLLSVKMEEDVIEIVEYLRSEIGLQPAMVTAMVREYPPILDVRPKRLKAVVTYMRKVLEIPGGCVADILNHYPKTCSLEAEANLAPLRHFFERELFVEDSARIGRLVCKFPRLLFQDVETQLKPRAEEFRNALGLEGMEPVPPPVRSRPKRNNNRPGDAGLDSNGRGRVPASEARRKERLSGYLGEERGNSRSGAGYRGQSRKDRSSGSGRGREGGGRVR